MIQRSVLLCATLATAGVLFTARSTPPLLAHDQEVTALAADRVIERRLNRGEEHRYGLALGAGDYASVTVGQHDIDLIVQVSAPDGSALAGFQDETATRGQVQADVVADTRGTYTFTVKPSPGTAASGAYAIRVATRRAATEADRSLQEIATARTAALRFQTEGRPAEARPLLERAMAIAESVRGPDDVRVAAVAAQLAEVYLLLPDRAKSESLFRRALAIREKTDGAGHPVTAFLRARLAIVYYQAGQVARAQDLLLPALAVIEDTLGPTHPWVVRCLVTLGNLRVAAGDLDRAEQTDRRALAILEATGEDDSASYLGLLNNLAVIYRQKKDYARAEDLFRRALAMSQEQRGPESTDVARILSNLALVANGRRDYASALEYYARSLSIHERISGPDHPDLATILNNLAVAYHATGDKGRSFEAHTRALRIRERTLGEYHPGTLQSVGNIALMHWLAGDIAQAVSYQRRADAIIETQLALNLAVGSERQKLALLSSSARRTYRTLSLHLGDAGGDPGAGALAALVLLQRKGRVLDAMTRTFRTARERIANPSDKQLLDQLNATTAQLARMILNAPEDVLPKEHQQSIAQLEARKERLESELSQHDAEFRAQTQSVTLQGVQAAIPRDAALIEYVVFRPFHPRIEGDDVYGPPHYAAYVMRSSGPPRGVDLGLASTIDDAVERLREALRDPKRRDVTTHARAVEQRIFRPLRAYLDGTTRLLISPDGALNLLPFESLVDDHGQYMIERYATSYLTSGRDLLRMQVKRGTGNPPVVIADPMFGVPAVQTPGPGATSGTNLSTIYFAPLPASAAEARAIQTLFPDTQVLSGPRATKAALLQADRPRMLHVASHGFFLPDAPGDPARALDEAPATDARARSDDRDNPLLRSGLAFAGANLTRGPRDEGILTALEASGLNLWGTKLVTLSACDTGLGKVRDGEGVYGLRRAFVLAGAETLVMSLWPVSDSITRETMVKYYAGLRAGAGRGDALRQAKLWMLKRSGRQHPFYWASFIQSGEWANLAGNR
jgi:CHAT domain-containing protein/Tfp pilus assembly protein PilF